MAVPMLLRNWPRLACITGNDEYDEGGRFVRDPTLDSTSDPNNLARATSF